MAYKIADRAFVNCSTAGIGTFTLGTAIDGYELFGTELTDGDTTTYVAFGGTDYEVGMGTYTAAGTLLSRDTVYKSSNSGSKVNWSGDYFVLGSTTKRDLQTAVNITGGTLSGITSLTMAGDLQLTDNDILRANMKDYSIEQFGQSGSGSVTLNYENGQVQEYTATGNITGWTINNWPASGTLGKIVVFLKQDGTGSHTCTFPAGWKWFDGDTAMTFTSAANAVDCFVIMTYDGGTTVYALIIGQNA